MKRLIFLLSLVYLFSTASAQSAADSATTQIRQLLKPGRHLLHYVSPGLREDTLEIIFRGNQLYFQGTGNAATLDSVRFDFARNRVLFKDKRIPFSRVHHSTGEDNAFHTPAVSYEYELQTSSMSDSTNVNTLRMESIVFGVARLTATGKTMLVFMTMNAEGSSISVKPVITVVAFLD